MSGLRSALGLTLLFALPCLACNQQTIEVQLHSLQASQDVAFICRTKEGKGVDRTQCRDFGQANEYKWFALVTQTSTEEVAVINVNEGKVVDLDPSAPGYSFLRVPSKPGDIVSTPGGAATFVGITSPGKTGLTAIPTTCIGAPATGETVRDVTSFPSCHLPTAPGELTVLIEPPDLDGTVHSSCADGRPEEDTSPPGAQVDECQANLTLEHLDPFGNVVGPRGRRKLAVALPDFGEIAIIDAQWLLDQTPGSFSECRIEARLPLEVVLGPAGTKQEAPPELVVPDTCHIEQPVMPPRPPSYAPRPSGFAPAGDRLYVADETAPVVHVLDTSNPCALTELAPLLPMSFEEPDREVFTSRLAASPLTPDGKRYVYAIDKYDQPAASLMMFDVSSDSTNRTPLVRPGSLRIPEPADRLRLATPIADVAFALRDLPAADPDTGVAATGVRCDPSYLTAEPGSPAAQHRPTTDETRGAQPRLLRGLFGLAMLTSGHVAVIDVDDFDAPCRRPYTTNDTDVEDFRGCFGDAPEPDLLTLNGTDQSSITVTNEVSCNIVEPHRFRSAQLNVTSTSHGTGAPSLVSFPDFARRDDDTNPTPAHLPKLLAVPFGNAADPAGAPKPPEVYVGTTLHKGPSLDAVGQTDLDTNPNTAQLSSLTLPFEEPRSVPAGDTANLVFEGAITRDFPNGTIVFGDPDPDDPDDRIEDVAANFCDKGIYDLDMLGHLAEDELGIEDSDAQVAFANAHADVVEVTSKFLSYDDSYWTSARLTSLTCGLTYVECVDTFGTYDALEVPPNRELTVERAYQSRLVVRPNAETAEARAELSKRFSCCFPQGIQYHVRVQNQWVLAGRASGLPNDVMAVTDKDSVPGKDLFRCQRSCDPKKTYGNNRVFEIASSQDCVDATGNERCTVGKAQPTDPCTYRACDLSMETPRGASCPREDATLDVRSTGDVGATRCIHSGLTSRFVVYRGLTPSVRGMTFAWQTTGGFRTLVTSLASVSAFVLPQRVDYLPELESIAIVDGAQLGLSLVSLDTLRVDDPWPVY